MWGKVGVGALGAITPSMYELVVSDMLVTSGLRFFLVSVSIYAVLGAIVIRFIRPATLWRCYFLGLASPLSLLIAAYIVAVVMYGMPFPEIPKAR